MSRYDALILTCEHAGNRVPAPYRRLFAKEPGILATHRGWDIGALKVAQRLEQRLGAPLFFDTVSRLVVELNRSEHHKDLFSRFTLGLPRDEREAILATYYRPYRDAVEDWIAARVAKRRRVLHVSVHSFTPELSGEVRRTEIGLLYDPRRAGEARFAGELHDALRAGAGELGLRIRRNYPYLGIHDGFMTHLRKVFPATRYVGLEIEMNQGIVVAPTGQRQMAALFGDALTSLL